MTDGRRERPDEIERDIEARRDDLAVTLDALQDRASPRVLAEGVGHALRDEGEDMLIAAARLVRRNPVAVAMIAAGAAWLALGPDMADRQRPRRRGPAKRARPQARTPAAQARRTPATGPVPGGTASESRWPAGSVSDQAPARLTPAPKGR
ncbi:MAG: DUF3618 domain-containing protein [Paracoccaceae bacterium]|jgi:hypothetical protein|nr:DUF3618 domain-containing protein [Paracoccaceae bacterium]